ncbi:hypothetical protein DL93DRAFT_2170251 [Clavulina sp. PMI_390]|nr:hypothetical protein DL93DRAFT_2170251 [Clavulina sp. PMI_390]
MKSQVFVVAVLAALSRTLASPVELALEPRTAAPPKCSPATAVEWLADCQAFGYNATLDIPGVECGIFTAPLDYADCSPGNATLAVARLNATVSPRLGTIFTNPGGPGDSGVSFMFTSGRGLALMTGGQYDIVSWDPRGVGLSLPAITCFSSPAEANSLVANNSILFHGGAEAYGNFTNPAGNDPDELAALSQENITDTHLQAIGAACLQAHGANLSYIGTAAAVRDMIALSDAIEGPGKKVDYWGFSYGTVIGSYFINMFPDRVGKVIIDGVVNPIPWTTQPDLNLWPGQIIDTHLVFDEFTSSCAAAGPLCAIAGANATQAGVASFIQKVMDSAFLAYQENPSPITNSSATVRLALHNMLYFPSQWATDAVSILEVAKSLNVSEAFALEKASSLSTPSPRSQSLLRKRARPSVLDTSDDDSNNAVAAQIALVAITCADSPDAGNVTTKDVFNALLSSANVSQMWGPEWPATYVCHKWPARAVERYTGPWNATLSEKVLIIANQGDPITPKANAELVAGMLGNSSAFLLRDGYGHTSLGENSTCTSAVITQFFNNGTTPALGTVCATNRNYFGSTTISNDSSSSSMVPTSAIYSATSGIPFAVTTSTTKANAAVGLKMSPSLLASTILLGFLTAFTTNLI